MFEPEEVVDESEFGEWMCMIVGRDRGGDWFGKEGARKWVVKWEIEGTK